MLKTVDQACDFIVEWCQEKGRYAGQPLDAGFAMPNSIVRLNAPARALRYIALPWLDRPELPVGDRRGLHFLNKLHE
jgi:hypothetical protein